MRTLLILTVTVGLCAAPATAQPAPTGAPFSTTHFTAQDYRAQPQNWGVAQDARGLMYVANNDGILQYDGARWRLIETGDGSSFTRSVAADSQGTVYAGAVGDFGVLRPDSTSTLRYVSFAERLPPAQRDFGDVWYTHATGGDVYFQSRSRLFRWNGDTLRSWKSETETFHTSFVVHGQLYVRESDRGLLRVEGDSLSVVPGGERFAGMSIYVMLPYGPNTILVGTSKEDFFLYDGESFEPFPTEADELLAEHQLYHGARLPGGEIALATLGGGVFIIDRAGRLVQVIDTDTALPDGTVNHVHADGQGGLWMALHNGGVFRAEVSAPLSRFGEGFGLEGIVQDLERSGETLHAATGAGVYRLNETAPDGQTRSRFEKVPGVPAAWDLLTAGGRLYAATRGGVHRIEEGQGTALVEQKTFDITTFDEESPQRIFVGTGGGLGVLRRRGGGWAIDTLARTNSEVRSLAVAENDEALWFSTLDGGVYRLSASELRREAYLRSRVQPQRFDTTNGLPSGGGTIVSFWGAPMFASQKGLYRVQRTATGAAFYPDTTLTGGSNGSSKGPLRAFYEADSSNAWLFYDDRVEIARRRANGTYARTAPPALQFPRSDMVRSLIEPERGAWISNGEELVRYDAVRAERLRGSRRDTPRVRIRRLRDAATEDIIYGGAAEYGGAAASSASVKVPYQQNSLRVAFGLPRYGGDAPLLYQYRLKGDAAWSSWQPDAGAVLGRFTEGTYTVQVRARNANAPPDTYSQASLTLEVLPPWYRTVWAYLAYLGMGLLAVAGYRHYRSVREERERAREAAERHRRETERERKAREQLQEAHDRLEEANRLKENFLANTSHEFRTPLASIMGYAEVLQDEDLPREQEQEFLSIIRSNGDRLLNTVDALLEISQLRAGTLHPTPTEMEVNQQVEEAAAPFREEAEEKGLTFRITPFPDAIHAVLPAAYVRRIVSNLVDNAVKFTQEGTVHVIVRGVGAGTVRIQVRDTGVGMDDPEALFAEFKQGSEGVTREYEGTGLGLTIAGRLARLMGGSIEVESAKCEGSTFTVHLPKELDGDASSQGASQDNPPDDLEYAPPP